MATVAAETRFIHSEISDEPLVSRWLQLNSYLALVDTVAAAGIPAPSEWQNLRGRLAQLGETVSHGHVMADRLCAAVLTGNGDIESLFASALAEHSAAAPDVLQPIHDQVLCELQRVGQPHAAAAWRVLRDRANRSARAFHAAAKLADPAAAADQVVDDGHPLAAWRDALARSEELESLIEPVMCCAELLRAGQPRGLGSSRAPLELPIFCANLDQLHRREAWSGWLDAPLEKPGGPLLTTDMQPTPHRPTRCGRWARMAAIGAEIHIAEDPAIVELYSRPRSPSDRSNQRRDRSTIREKRNGSGSIPATPSTSSPNRAAPSRCWNLYADDANPRSTC